MSTAKNKIFHYAKVGIGTESPQKQLQILGDSDTCLRITSSSNGVASLQLGDVDDTVKGAITFLNSDNSLRIRGHNNNDRISIKSGGHVNIGGDYDNTTYPFKLTGSGGGDAAAMAIQNLGSHPAKLHLMSGHGNWSVSNSTTIGDALEFRDEGANSTRMMIDSNGNVGINETSPDARLHISSPASTTCEIRLTANNTGTGAGDRGRINVYSALNDGTAYQAGYVDIDRSSGTDDKAHLVVALNNGSGVGERLRITSGGNVGINEANPAAQLHVENNNAHSSTYYLNTDAAILVQNKNSNASGKTVLKLEGPGGGGDCALVYGGSATNMIFADRQNERLRITQTGVVEIDRGSSADQAVDIKTTATSGATRIRFMESGSDKAELTYSHDNDLLELIGMSGNGISFITNGYGNERLRIRSDGKIIMGTGIPTYTNSIVHVEGAGINFESSYTLEDGTGASPQFSIFGSNSHVRIDMGTLNVAPYAGYIQARFDNDPEQSGTSAAGREPLMINPKGGVVTFNLSDSNATSEIGGGSTGTQGGIVMRAGRANSTTVNNASTAIKIFPGEIRAYSGGGGTGEQNQGTKYGGIAWNILDPHNGSWGTQHDGHHCWMGMSLHSTPNQEKSNWQVQMNSDASAGSYATKVAIQANPEGYITKPNQPSFYVRRSTGGDNRPAASPVTEWANPGTTQSSGNPVHNIGGHFSHTTGKFTAPIHGVYHFDAAAGYKQSGYDFNQKIYINGSAQAEGVRFIDGGDDLVNHSTSTMSLTCYLHKGDEVHLELGYTHHVNTTFNYFSGYLVQ